MKLLDRLQTLEAAVEKTNQGGNHPPPEFQAIIEYIKAESRLPLEVRIERWKAETYRDHPFISRRNMEGIRDICVRQMEEELKRQTHG